MNIRHFQRLIDYNYWAHRLVWDCAAQLDDEAYFRPSTFSIGSVHQQLVHTMAAEWLWLERARGLSPDALLTDVDYPTREAVRERWDMIERDCRAFLHTLDDSALDKPIRFTSIQGSTVRDMQLWEALSTIVNHSTDHRAQTLALIHQLGGKTVQQDYVFYAWENAVE